MPSLIRELRIVGRRMPRFSLFPRILLFSSLPFLSLPPDTLPVDRKSHLYRLLEIMIASLILRPGSFIMHERS